MHYATSTRGISPWSREVNQPYATPHSSIGAANCRRKQPKDIKTDERKKNEVKLITWIYDQTTGEFLGLQKHIAYIVL